MDEKKAFEILSDQLGSKYQVLEMFLVENDIFHFHVKEQRYMDDDFVLPDVYGVDVNGKVLNFDEILEIERAKEAD